MILVTGSSGFIGRALKTSFGDKAIGLQRSPDDVTPRQYACDLTNIKDVERVANELSSYKFTHLIHTAAVTPWSNESSFRPDKAMADSVMRLCESLSIPSLLFISGWNVYDPAAPAPFDEQTPLNPVDAYGKSKYEVENILTDGLKNTFVLNLRLASVYGPGQVSKGLIPNLVRSALHGQDIYIDGATVKRDYIYIDDVVEAVHFLIARGGVGTGYLNIGSGESVNVVAVAETIQSVCRKLYKIDIQIHPKDLPVSSVLPDNQLDITVARSMGMLLHNTPLERGIETYVIWREKHENILRS